MRKKNRKRRGGRMRGEEDRVSISSSGTGESAVGERELQRQAGEEQLDQISQAELDVACNRKREQIKFCSRGKSSHTRASYHIKIARRETVKRKVGSKRAGVGWEGSRRRRWNTKEQAKSSVWCTILIVCFPNLPSLMMLLCFELRKKTKRETEYDETRTA